MIFILSFFSYSICDRIFEIADFNNYQSVSTSPNESICFLPQHSRSLLLFNHINEYEVNSYQIENNNTLLNKEKLKEEEKVLIGVYFGSSNSNQIELKSTKSSTFSYISSVFPHDCLNVSVSTLENDQIIFNDNLKSPSCFFHACENSTYTITIDADNTSLLIGLKNGIQFNGKMTDYIISSSELFYWVPSQLDKNANFKASIIIGIPNKANNHHGFKQYLNPDQFSPIFIDNYTDGDDKDPDDQGQNYPPKFSYNNIYQNGSVIFPTILSMILCFVCFFFVSLIIVRLVYYCYRRNIINATQHLDDIPPVEPLHHFDITQNGQHQNIGISPIHPEQQYSQNSIQQYFYYPTSLNPHFIQTQQQNQLQVQPYFIQQHNPQTNFYQQTVYI